MKIHIRHLIHDWIDSCTLSSEDVLRLLNAILCELNEERKTTPHPQREDMPCSSTMNN